MSFLRVIIALAGFAFASYLIWRTGGSEVLSATGKIGWGLLFVVAIEFISLALRASAWRLLLSSEARPVWPSWFVARWVRQSVSQLLPVAQVGGDFAGARVIAKLGLLVDRAVACTVVDLTLGASAQMIFSLLGILILFALLQSAPSLGILLFITLVLFISIIVFAYLQQRGLVGRFLRRAARRSEKFAQLIADADAIDVCLRDIYQHRAKVVKNLTIQLITQIATSIEVWLVCWWLGFPIGFAEAFVVQALTRTARAAAFFVPAGIGVQELSVMWIASAFGIPPANGLAIALVKRAREILVGFPAIAYWSYLEARAEAR